MGFKINGKRWRYADTYDIKGFFGREWPTKWPDEGIPPIEVAGEDNDGYPVPICVEVFSKERAKAYSPKSRRPRRVWATCPDCCRYVCAGHTIQHVCKP